MKEKAMSKALEQVIDDFCTAYSIQKGIDFDRLELCTYEESNGKRAVIYFSAKRENVKSESKENSTERVSKQVGKCGKSDLDA